MCFVFYRILVFLLLLPLILFSIYCSTFGKKPIGLPVGIVTKELKSISDCDKNFTLSYGELATSECYILQPLSCRYLKFLKKEEIKLVSF